MFQSRTSLNHYYERRLFERDKKIGALKTRLSLAQRAHNKTEVSRLARQIKQLGQSL